MGIEFYLAKDGKRELYNLGKFSGNWASLIADPTCADVADRGLDFRVRSDRDVDLIAGLLEEDWRGSGVGAPVGYLRKVAEDVVRWAGDDSVRLTSDASQDWWLDRDGSQGRVTGSRYSTAHPEWSLTP